MKLTAAERNHLFHYLHEQWKLKRGPALSWSGEHGFFHHGSTSFDLRPV